MIVQGMGHYHEIKNFYAYLDVHVWCEKCSTEEHPILMNEVELWHICPICKHEVMVMADIISNRGDHYATDCKRCKELEEKGIVFGRQKKG